MRGLTAGISVFLLIDANMTKTRCLLRLRTKSLMTDYYGTVCPIIIETNINDDILPHDKYMNVLTNKSKKVLFTFNNLSLNHCSPPLIYTYDALICSMELKTPG